MERRTPTQKQIELLLRFKIPVLPTTCMACSSLISFILSGPESCGRTPHQRARFVRKWFGCWVEVVDRGSPFFRLVGTVERLRMRTEEERVYIREKHNVTPLPFDVVVRFETGRPAPPRILPLSAVKIVKDAEQLLLFDP